MMRGLLGLALTIGWLACTGPVDQVIGDGGDHMVNVGVDGGLADVKARV